MHAPVSRNHEVAKIQVRYLHKPNKKLLVSYSQGIPCNNLFKAGEDPNLEVALEMIEC